MLTDKDWTALTFLRAVYVHLSPRRRAQLASLLLLQIANAGAEVLSLGAIIPFLAAIANADGLLANPALAPWLAVSGIETARALIITLAILFGVAVIIANGVRLLTIWAQMRLGAAIGNDLSAEVYRRTLCQPYSFHVRNNSSTVVSGITQDLAAALGCVPQTFALITNGLVIAAILATLLVYSPITALACILFGGSAYAAIMAATKRKLNANSLTISDNSGRRIRAMQEGLGGIRDVLIDGSHAAFVELYAKADGLMRFLHAENRLISQAPRYLLEAIGLISFSAVVVMLTATDMTNIQATLPLLGALAMAANRLLPALQQSYQVIADIRSAKTQMRRTLEALERPVDPTAIGLPAVRLPFSGSIVFDHVWFGYGDGTADTKQPEAANKNWAIRDLTLTIPAKSTIAFIGSTGSGKSTIGDLLLGLLQPQKGAILVDGKPLSGSRLRAWQAAIAHVPQNIFLADSSIAENIAFGCRRSEIDMERVVEAARNAKIHDFIVSRPNGYDEFIGERGIRISGGQRQRIGIARALYKRASVIVFDEATSALDNATEREVMAAIDSISRKFTIILIAHRLSTIEKADVIYEIADGSLVQSGQFRELLETSEAFREQVLLVSDKR